jgi:hypothetical protein
MAFAKADQHPSSQEPNRQAADVAEKQPRHGLVEWREPDKRSTESGGRERHRARYCTEQSEKSNCERDRRDFGDRDPIDAVHEIGEIDEPQQPDHEQRPLDPPRQHRKHAHAFRQQRDDADDDRGLHDQARRRGQRSDIVERSQRR